MTERGLDDDLTPTAAVHDKMEAEANFAAGSLLFLGDRFVSECRDCTPSIATAQRLKKRYGNTFTTTLWRMIEHAGLETPMIGQHPNQFHNEKPDSVLAICCHAIGSLTPGTRMWHQAFSNAPCDCIAVFFVFLSSLLFVVAGEFQRFLIFFDTFPCKVSGSGFTESLKPRVYILKK